jgi:hypothetical protein
MSEAAKPRELKEVQVEYSNVCARIGHAKLQIKQLTKDIDLLLEQLERLNFEAIAIQNELKAEADKSAAATEESK